MSRAESPPQLAGFEHVRHLGSGGFADVHLYRQRSPYRDVAVKVLRAERLTDAVRRQFETEANTMAGLGGHPHIVQIFEVNESPDGRPYLTMEFYPGDHLGKRLGERGRMPVDEVLRIGVQIAGAVQTAHQANVLHRDIKPGNILVSVADDPGLADFGIAGPGTDDEDDPGVSIPWSPPEVLTGESNGTVASDVYSLAATLWQLLVGRSPFVLPGERDVRPPLLIKRIREMPAPATGRTDHPPTLDRLLRQALAKDPRQRPRSAEEFGRGLQQIEQEMRYPRTKLVVLGEPRAEQAPEARGVEPTRQRPAVPAKPAQPAERAEPARFAPHRPAPPQDEPAGATRQALTRVRVQVPQRQPSQQSAQPAVASRRETARSEPPEPGTVLRPRTVQAQPAATSTATPASATPAPAAARRVVVAVVAGVMALAVGVLVTFALHGAARGQPAAAPTVFTPPPDPLSPSASPQVPDVSAKRVGNRYVFSWTPKLPNRSAYYVVLFLDESTPYEKKVRTQTLSVPALGRVCIQVRIVTTSAELDAPPSQQTCAGGP